MEAVALCGHSTNRFPVSLACHHCHPLPRARLFDAVYPPLLRHAECALSTAPLARIERVHPSLAHRFTTPADAEARSGARARSSYPGTPRPTQRRGAARRHRTQCTAPLRPRAQTQPLRGPLLRSSRPGEANRGLALMSDARAPEDCNGAAERAVVRGSIGCAGERRCVDGGRTASRRPPSTDATQRAAVHRSHATARTQRCVSTPTSGLARVC